MFTCIMPSDAFEQSAIELWQRLLFLSTVAALEIHHQLYEFYQMCEAGRKAPFHGPASKKFTQKISLAHISYYRLQEIPAYAISKLEVRRYNGLFWKKTKERMCVLQSNGYLLVYWSLTNGVAINLAKVNDITTIVSVKNNSESETETFCEIIIFRTRERFSLRICGKEEVAKWRSGIVRAHQNQLPLNEENNRDEYWCHPGDVSPEGGAVWEAVNARRIRINRSLPQLKSLNYSLEKQFTEIPRGLPRTISATIRSHATLLTSVFRKTDSNNSFGSTFYTADNSCLTNSAYMESGGLQMTVPICSPTDVDSGIHSPTEPPVSPETVVLDGEDPFDTEQSENDETEETLDEEKRDQTEKIDERWKENTIGNEMPILYADMLNMESFKLDGMLSDNDWSEDVQKLCARLSATVIDRYYMFV